MAHVSSQIRLDHVALIPSNRPAFDAPEGADTHDTHERNHAEVCRISKGVVGGSGSGVPPPSKSLVGGVVGGSSHSRDKPLVDLCDCYLF